MVKEVVLVSGISIIGDVEEVEDRYVILNPYLILAGEGRVVFAPLTKVSQPPSKIEVSRDQVLAVETPFMEVIKAYSDSVPQLYRESKGG